MTDVGTPAIAPPAAPYVGLHYYTEHDAQIFFGRDNERRKVIGNIRSSRLTLLYASSGVGKSSLLRAGVAARLQELADSSRGDGDGVRYVPVVLSSWSDDPTEALVAEVRAAIADNTPAAATMSQASDSVEQALIDAADAADATLLVILDQFEEFFLYHSADTPFVDDLARCVSRPDLRAHFLIAIRDDAYARVGDLFKGRISNVYANYLQLGHLDRDAARDAICKPLARFNDANPGALNVEVQPELVEAVLDQVQTGQVLSDHAGRGGSDFANGGRSADEIETPFLQLVMTRLWETEAERGSRTLRLSTLDELGGAGAIVRTHLDAALEDLSEHERTVAADVFHHLITPSGAKIAHDVPSLAEYTGHSEADIDAVLDKLSRGHTRIVRHLPPPPGHGGSPRFEVFHDVLAMPILDWRARQTAERLDRERRRLEVRSRRLTLVLISVIAITIGLMVYIAQPSALQRLELGTVDARFGLKGAAVPSNVVIVGIDKASFAALADPATRIIPRATDARALSEIWQGRPSVIAEDVIFGPSRPGDPLLSAAIHDASGHVVLAADELNGQADTTLFGHDPATGEGGTAFVRGLGAEPGYVGVAPDPDGTLRHFQESVGLDMPGTARMSTLPVAVARLDDARVPRFDSAWIDYQGPPGTITRVSFLSLVRGRVSPQRFHDKIVFIGATAPGVDAHPSPAGDGSVMPGVEILANAAWTALHGLPLHGSRGVDFALIVLLGLVPLASLRLRPWGSLLVCAAAAVVFLLVAQAAFDADLIVSVVYPLLALVLSTAGVLGTQAILGARRTPQWAS